jgi:HlyD family secretion protein
MSKHKRRVIRWVKRILLTAGAAGIVVAIVNALIPDAVVVDMVVVSRGPLDVEIREDGQTRVRDRFVVAAPIGGELARIGLDPGSEVERGTVLAHIEPAHPALLDDRTRSETIARVAAARARERSAVATVSRARSASVLAASEAKRARTLLDQRAITGSEHERAVTAADVAAEDLAAAEQARFAAAAEVQALRAVLDPRGVTAKPYEVTSPSRGRILRVIRESGGPIAAGTPLVEIGDPGSLEVVIDVLSRDAERIAPGMLVELETAGTLLRGTVVLVEPSAFTRISALGVEEQRVNVVVCFAGPPSLGDAYRVDARIIVWHDDDVLRIPASALFRDRGRWAVFVAAEGRAALRPVFVGHRGRTDVEITQGLSAGEIVIVHPSDQIADRSRVTPRH